MSRSKIRGIIILFLTASFLQISGCTIIKMGSLFLSGHLDRKGFTKEVDFQYQGDLIFLAVRLNDLPREYRFVFDTGAAFNVLSTRVAEDIGIEAVAKDTIKDASKRTGEVKFAKIPKITIAGIPFQNTATAVMDIDTGPRLKCYRIEGVIGTNLMRLVNTWRIDYRRKKITFSDHEELVPEHKEILTLGFKRNMQRIPEIDLKINDHLKIKCEIDLGSANSFMSDLSTLEKIKKHFPGIHMISGTGEMGGGALGSLRGTTYVVPLKNAWIGNAHIGPIFMNIKNNAFSSIGNGFFRNYTITFNWEKNRLTLLPYSSSRNPLSFPTFGFGIGFDETDKSFYINFLYRRSSADDCGLKLGDKLLSIDGKTLGSITEEDYCRYLFEPESLLGKDEKLMISIDRNGQSLTYHLFKTDLVDLS
ncbi:MAG: aspartyl protease family protein [Candidatus Aminicenantes bacterium]|nr:aspartyl protease family protein [Candidatus Aminicenantes bacterium]